MRPQIRSTRRRFGARSPFGGPFIEQLQRQAGATLVDVEELTAREHGNRCTSRARMHLEVLISAELERRSRLAKTLRLSWKETPRLNLGIDAAKSFGNPPGGKTK